MNHIPLMRNHKLPNHASLGDTADAFSHIDCPTCRSMLETKVSAHRETARKSRGQVRDFFNGDADAWQATLDQ